MSRNARPASRVFQNSSVSLPRGSAGHTANTWTGRWPRPAARSPRGRRAAPPGIQGRARSFEGSAQGGELIVQVHVLEGSSLERALTDRQHALHASEDPAPADPGGERRVEEQDEQEIAFLDPRPEVDGNVVDHSAVLEGLVTDPDVLEEGRQVHGGEHGLFEVVQGLSAGPAIGWLERASHAALIVDVDQVPAVRRELEVSALDVRAGQIKAEP